MTSSPTPEQTDKLTLEGLMDRVREYGAVAADYVGDVGTPVTALLTARGHVSDYAARLIEQAAQETMSDEEIKALWLHRSNLHGGDLMLQLLDFARAILASKKETP